MKNVSSTVYYSNLFITSLPLYLVRKPFLAVYAFIISSISINRTTACKNYNSIHHYPNIPNIFAFRTNCQWSQTIDCRPAEFFSLNSNLEIRPFPNISAMFRPICEQKIELSNKKEEEKNGENVLVFVFYFIDEIEWKLLTLSLHFFLAVAKGNFNEKENKVMTVTWLSPKSKYSNRWSRLYTCGLIFLMLQLRHCSSFNSYTNSLKMRRMKMKHE